MARIKNIELPGEKHTCIGLTAIYGIGRNLALTICGDAKVEPTKKIKDLSEDEISRLRKEIDKYVVEGDLRRDVQMSSLRFVVSSTIANSFINRRNMPRR